MGKRIDLKGMKASDVTKGWVCEHFDLDKERKTISRAECIGTFAVFEHIKEDLGVDELVKRIKSKVDSIAERANLLDAKKNQEFKLRADQYEYNELCEMEVYCYWDEEESDIQVISRLVNRERAKIRKRLSRYKEAENTRLRELKELHRLKKKYEN